MEEEYKGLTVYLKQDGLMLWYEPTVRSPVYTLYIYVSYVFLIIAVALIYLQDQNTNQFYKLIQSHDHLSASVKFATMDRAGLTYGQAKHGVLAYKAILAYKNIGTWKKKCTSRETQLIYKFLLTHIIYWQVYFSN